MSVRVTRVFAIAAASLLWLAGCETTSTTSPFNSLASAIAPDGQRSPDTTGSVVPASLDSPPKTPELLGNDPTDDLSTAKQYFRQGSYGLAERSFRRAVEEHPRSAEAWVGLAASYDQLKRFDLADRAYGQAIRLVGSTPEIMNNQGFSYMLRGDYARARTTLLAAQAKDPASPYIRNNLALLAESARKAKAVN